MEKLSEIMTLEEVSLYLRVSEKTVKEWVQRGDMPGGKLGTSWRFLRIDIELWVSEQLSRGKNRNPTIEPLHKLLPLERISIVKSTTKVQILDKLIHEASEISGSPSKAAISKAVYEREALMSTGIGLSIAVPHIKIGAMSNPEMFLCLSTQPIVDYDSLDNLPVQIVVFIMAGKNQHAEHIRCLATVSSLLKNRLIREQILSASTPETICEILRGVDAT